MLNLKSKIPTYLPLSDAAKKYGLSEKALTQQIRAGKIEAVQLPTGELLVAASNNNGQHKNKTKQEIIAEEFTHLHGQTISLSEASRKYSEFYGISISHQIFSRWVEAGYIKVLDRGYRLQLDEADVAYCAKIYAEKYHEYDGQMAGVHIFNEEGNPYQIKYREIAELRRIERRTKKVR